MKIKVPNFDGYFADTNGNVYGKDGRILKPKITNKGYLSFKLRKNGVSHTMYAHRIIAISFIPNPDNKPLVNHINHNRKDNFLKNLEWATYTENIQHDYDCGIRDTSNFKKAVSKMVLNLNTGIFYESITEASNTTNYAKNYLAMMLTGYRRNKTPFVYC